MFGWLRENKDAITVIMAITSVLITGIVWTFNHQYNQYIRIGIIEKNVLDLQRSFSSYHRTLLLTELVKVEQGITEIQEKINPTLEDKNALIDLLVKQQVLTREIAEIGNTQ